MANPVLHIKDSYYFELPKMLYPANYERLSDFPDVWVSLDEDYQNWHFERVYNLLNTLPLVSVPPDGKEKARELWHHWQHENHDNAGKPFDEFLEVMYQERLAEFDAWKAEYNVPNSPFDDKVKFERLDTEIDELFWTFFQARYTSAQAWQEVRRKANDVAEFKNLVRQGKLNVKWDEKKIDAYNYHLSGKVLIPQPFNARLRNLYEAHPANHWYELALSKFMIIEMAVGLIMLVAFAWVGRKVAAGDAPRGKIWNLLETFLVFIRDQIAVPSIGHHDAHRFLPYLWTIFFFVLGCNLFGMVPWAGSPTGTFGVTLGLAALTFAFVVVGSMGRFGFFGFFKNLVPHMDLPLLMAIFIKPMLFVIELGGLIIKHAVLGVRLLANMMAGHLVLLAIMGIAFSIESVSSMENWQWGIAATAAVLGSAALSLLELFVAFLQAYIFTFLSALFIGAAMHEH